MQSKDMQESFQKIRDFFLHQDRLLYASGQFPVRSTVQGIWGPSVMEYVFDMFQKLELNKCKHFIDLGSGDGRIVWIASLFTDATGMESDPTFHNLAIEKQPDVNPYHKITFAKKDYHHEDLSKFDFLFCNPDHTFPDAFVAKLVRECNGGKLIIYNNIYPVFGLQKQKTLWYDQFPILMYNLKFQEKRQV